MFTQAWKKHLPVIALFLKKAAGGDQTLEMNYTDFERAAGGKKVKCAFSGLQITNGVLNSASLQSPVANEFARVLQESSLTDTLLRGRRFEFSLSSKFTLTIKNTTESAAIAVNNEEVAEAEPA
jgi:hypothetical protein